MPHYYHQDVISGGWGGSLVPQTLRVAQIQWQRFSLPLAKPLTTSATPGSDASLGAREGVIVRISLSRDLSSPEYHGTTRSTGSGPSGVGEISPLPGLHRETLEESERQLALVSELLSGARLPRTVAILGGRMGQWLGVALGFDPAQLHPSVR